MSESPELDKRLPPDSPEGAEARIARAIQIIDAMANDVARLATTVSGIASHPNIYTIVEKVDELSPALTDIGDMLGVLDLHALFEDYGEEEESEEEP